MKLLPWVMKSIKKVLKTPYGNSPEVSIFKLHGKEVAFMPRHTKGHSKPPHMVNYRANVYAMKKLGVRQNYCNKCCWIS
jgi:5'-methylthioadenosine phosphorylase